MEHILSSGQEELLAAERGQLRALQETLGRTGAEREDLATLERSIRQLDELFLLVVVGEFNAGKSTFINALLGQRLLEEGVTPTTSRIHVLHHAEAPSRETLEPGLDEIGAPSEMLRHLRIVDTPGTNALERRHETITSEFVPRSDLVLFVTSADRPFTESERDFIERIREWGKKVVFIVNKTDFLTGEGDVAEVTAFIRDNAEKLLGFTPEIFAVSARDALAAKLDGDGDGGLEAGGFPALERYLVETLDQVERIRLKLLNPLGVGRKLAAQHRAGAEERMGLLREDFEALEDIDRQLDLYREDMGREFRFRLTDVDNILHEFEKRGMEFFDDNLRLARAFDLLNKARIKADFERKVIGDAPREIESKVDEIIDWMVAAELRQWRAVSEGLERRRERHSDRLLGGLGSFDYDRNQLLETVGRAARSTVDAFDRERESNRMAESVQTAVAGTALLEVGALGLGAVVTMLATTQLADVTGLLAAGTLAVLGLFILPARRKRAKKELSEKILSLREQLLTAITGQFEQEIERSVHRIREAVAPYTRFVRAERRRLEETLAELETAESALGSLEARVREL